MPQQRRPAHPVQVSFLKKPPVIDGCMTVAKRALPSRPFDHLIQPAEGRAPADASYRLAYGTSFLYVLIQVPGDQITCRDRGYQNGDGFVVVLAKPKPDLAPSYEYTMLSFWPQDDPVRPFRTMLWGTNGRWPLTPLPESVRHAARAENGVINLEALIPWEVVSPYHPWLSEGIGIDVLFAHAVADGKTEVYTIAFEDLSQVSMDHALYRPCEYAAPEADETAQIFVQSPRNLAPGKLLNLEAVTLASAKLEDELSVRLLSGEGDYIRRERLTIRGQPGVSRQEQSIALNDLPPGGYRVQWLSQHSSSQGDFGLTILPPFNPADDLEKLKHRQGIDELVLDTIEFRAEEISQILAATKPYETCSRVRPAMDAYQRFLKAAESGKSILQQGIVRLAYRSALDGTLQPFTVVLPEGFDPEKTYPLLVHLHGSERDDTAVAHFSGLYQATEMIVLAPYGRGTSNLYAKDNAQDDIREALAKACLVLPIDQDHIVLAGFSMGGYGVYHTYAENREIFRAIAPFSGMPTARWNPEVPDYASDDLQGIFLDVPMFVFHGMNDFNVPFQSTEKLLKALRSRGHKQITVCLEEGGHGLPNAENTERFHRWLSEVFAS